jgi:hypothetical protein
MMASQKTSTARKGTERVFMSTRPNKQGARGGIAERRRFGENLFGFLTRAHLDLRVTVDLALADRTANIEARLAVQVQTLGDLERRIAQIDAAIEESTRRGRPAGTMALADQTRRDRADLAATRQRAVETLVGMQIEEAKVDGQRKRAEADVGPVRYLAELIGASATDLEHPIRLLTLALVAVLDPLAIALLLAAGVCT